MSDIGQINTASQSDRIAQPAHAVEPKNERSNAVWLIAISSALLLSVLPFSSYIVALPFIRNEWTMSNTQASLVFSIYLVGCAVSSLVLVPLTDSISPRRILLLGISVMVCSHLLFPLLAWNCWSAALLRFIAGAGHIAVYIPGIQLVSGRFNAIKRGTAVSTFVGIGYCGTTVSYSLMGSLLSRTESWRTAYLLTALPGLIGVGLACALGRNDAVERRSRQRSLDLAVLRNRGVALVTLAYSLHTAELYLARLWLPLLLGATLMQSGRSELEATALAGTLAGLMFVTGAAGVFVGGALSDRLGRTASAVAIGLLSGVCSFIVGWLVQAPPAFLVCIGFVYGFATAADSSIYSTALTELSQMRRTDRTSALPWESGLRVLC